MSVFFDLSNKGTRMTPTPSMKWGYPAATVDDFDLAYLQSQPTAVQAALSFPSSVPGSDAFSPMSLTTAMALAAQGFFIDYEIMVEFEDPYVAMKIRLNNGQLTYTDATGKMTRQTSANPADYPPFTPVAPPPPPPAVSLVGAATGNPYVNAASPYNGWAQYNSAPGTNNSAINPGDPYTGDSRGTFYKIVTQTPFGPEIFWVLQP